MRIMIDLKAIVIAALFVVTACTDSAAVAARGAKGAEPMGTAPSAAEVARRDSIRQDSIEKARIVHVPTPDTLRGLYVNRWAALGQKMNQLIEVAKTTRDIRRK